MEQLRMIKNYNYAKIIDDQIVFATNPLKVNETIIIINPRESDYLENGYQRVIEEPMPQDGKHYVSKYIIRDGRVVLTWIEVEETDNNL